MQLFERDRPRRSATIGSLCACLVISAALIAGGCSSSTTTTPTATPAVASTEYFTGSLTRGGTAFYSFSVANAGTAEVTLASTTSAKVGPATPLPLRIGIGTPLGEGCTVVRSVDTSPGLSAQLLNALGAGVYCINVADLGAVSNTVLFTVRIVHT